MKLLIVGLDGGERSLIERFDMPFLSGLIDSGKALDVKEDLFSRGWAEIFTGKHGRETAAFYLRPECNGTRAFNKSFKLEEALRSPGVKPLWRVAENAGCKIGWMNMPTVSPAQQVDGFFVAGSAGGGGGGSIDDQISEVSGNTEDVRRILEEVNYITDVRVLPSSDFGGIEQFFALLSEMVIKRTEAYLELSKKYGQDFGFIGYRALNIVQNVAMSEIGSVLGLNREDEKWCSAWECGLRELYANVDACVKKLFSELNPESHILVADHGAAPFRFRMDANHVLQRLGYQKKSLDVGLSLKQGVKRLLFWLPRFRGNSQTGVIRTKVDYTDSLAFVPTWYIPGIYLNDKARFGGPIKDRKAELKLVENICDDFNSDREVVDSGIRAIPYSLHFNQAQYYDYLPDIWIKTPDDVYPCSASEFLTRNEWYAEVPSPSGLPASVYTGLKGSQPLAVCSGNLAQFVRDSDEKNMSQVYHVVSRFLSKG